MQKIRPLASIRGRDRVSCTQFTIFTRIFLPKLILIQRYGNSFENKIPRFFSFSFSLISLLKFKRLYRGLTEDIEPRSGPHLKRRSLPSRMAHIVLGQDDPYSIILLYIVVLPLVCIFMEKNLLILNFFCYQIQRNKNYTGRHDFCYNSTPYIYNNRNRIHKARIRTTFQWVHIPFYIGKVVQ